MRAQGELLPLNLLPLNQLCKEKLREAGEETHPTGLYLLQLCRWALDNALDMQGGGLRYKLENLLYDLDRMDPLAAVRAFYPDGCLKEVLSMVDELRAESPAEVAQYVIESLILEQDLL